MSLYLLLVALLPNSGARAVNFLALVEIVFIARYSSIVRGWGDFLVRTTHRCSSYDWFSFPQRLRCGEGVLMADDLDVALSLVGIAALTSAQRQCHPERRCTYRPSVICLIVNKLLSLSLSLSLSPKRSNSLW